MAGIARTAGLAVVGSLAVPAAGFSGLVALFLFGAMFIDKSARCFTGFLYAGIASAICYFSIRILIGIAKRARLQVKAVNAKEGLQLSAKDLLGYPGPAYMVFDTKNRKLAVCNSATGHYKISDFTYLVSWRYEYTSTEKFQGSGYAVGNSRRVRSVRGNIQEERSAFELILEVADGDHPVMAFPMATENRAKTWCSKLNSMVNGGNPDITYGRV